jgi:P27 family predicted phage terminase small subunit
VTSTNPRAPGHLSEESRRFWAQVCRDYALQLPHFRLLQVALEAWDRMNEARAILDRDGIVTFDRYEKPKAHPAVTIERDSRLAFIRALRELDLEGEPLPDPRPTRRV